MAILPLFLLLLLFQSCLAIRPSPTDDDYGVLSAVKASITHMDSLSSSWNTTDCCTWVGVSCDGDHRHVTALDIAGKNVTGKISPQICALRHLQRLDLSHNRFHGTLPVQISDCKYLTHLDLSRNNITGEIPSEITGMIRLNYLNLSRNSLSGGIPVSLSTMGSLSSIDFSFNDLSGSVPETSESSILRPSAFVGNPRLCGGLPFLRPCISGPSKKDTPLLRHLSFVIVVIEIPLVLFCGFKLFSWIMYNYCWTIRLDFHHLHFTPDEVMSCVKEDNIIGKGAAGNLVYRGSRTFKCVPSSKGVQGGMQFAVKQLPEDFIRSKAQRSEFNSHIQTLGKISNNSNNNIVTLLALCSKKEKHLLVYEYMPGGSLADVLHGSSKRHSGHFLDWHDRYWIARDAARGLCYLHHSCSPLIVHGNLKSTNILLGKCRRAFIADIGLAGFLQDPATSGCMAPEYAHTLKVDEKIDVYSFGVVLLELVSGRKPVGEFGDCVDLVQWVRKSTGGKKEGVLNIMDPGLSSAPLNEVMHVFDVAMCCVEEKAVDRPTMLSVVQILSQHPIPGQTSLPSASASPPTSTDEIVTKSNPNVACDDLL